MEWTDLIADFMSLTEGAISPPLFRKWSAITMISGALERRVWAKTGPRVVFANLYVLLVAPPGIGKFVVEEVRNLWQDVKQPGTQQAAFSVASDSVTNASLMDELGKSKNIFLPPQDPAITFHSLLVPAEEFQVLLPSYDLQFIASLNSIYNNKLMHKESRRTGTVRELKIEKPQFTILAGAQPSYFASTFPEEAWSTGFARRVIMVYSPEAPYIDLFDDPGEPEVMRLQILSKLASLSLAYGQMLWMPDAAECIRQWHKEGLPPVPKHSKLAHYNRSRIVHTIKLCIVSAIARCGPRKLIIDLIDVKRAQEWLLEAEALMPDIFREMIGKSDTQVIEEMHLFVTSIWAKSKAQPVRGDLIWAFLAQRVPSDKIEKILMVAERSNVICRIGGTADLWKPIPRHEHGVE